MTAVRQSGKCFDSIPQSCVAVAQISNLLYRGFPIRKPGKVRASANRRRPAEWNSAIQQIGNLRYESSCSTQPRLRHYFDSQTDSKERGCPHPRVENGNENLLAIYEHVTNLRTPRADVGIRAPALTDSSKVASGMAVSHGLDVWTLRKPINLGAWAIDANFLRCSTPLKLWLGSQRRGKNLMRSIRAAP